MLETSKTRIILDGKILSHVDKITLHFDSDKPFPYARIHKDDSPVQEVDLLNIDIVPENHLNKHKETETWSQIICQSKNT